MLVISTAGWDRTGIAWEVRSIAEREPDWYFSSRGQCASWISPAWLDQQRRTLPAHVFARLHENRWVEGVGAFLTAEEVDRCFVPALPAEGTGVRALGLDLGVTRDRSVLAVVRVDAEPAGLVRIEALITWTPRRGTRVDLQAVEDEAVRTAQALGAPVVFDPWQAVLMGQRLQAAGVATLEYGFTADGPRKLFGTLLDLIRTGRLRSRPHEDLRRELLGLEVQETAGGGWRVDHRVGRRDDHVVAVALAIAGLMTVPPPAGELTRGEAAALHAAFPFLTPAGDEEDPAREIAGDEDDGLYQNQWGRWVR